MQPYAIIAMPSLPGDNVSLVRTSFAIPWYVLGVDAAVDETRDTTEGFAAAHGCVIYSTQLFAYQHWLRERDALNPRNGLNPDGTPRRWMDYETRTYAPIAEYFSY